MNRAGQPLADRVYEFLQAMGYRALGNHPSGDLIDRVTSDRLSALNPHLSERQRCEALELFRRRTMSLAEREWAHTVLLHGIRVSPEGEPVFTAQLLAFDTPEDNIFQVAREVSLGNSIVDIGLYINGVLVGFIECTEAPTPGASSVLPERLVRLGQKGGAGLTTVHIVAALSPNEAIYGGVGAPSSDYHRFAAAYPSEADFRQYHQAVPTLHGEFLYSLFAPANLLEFLRFLTDINSQGANTVAGPFQRIAAHQALTYFEQAASGDRPLPDVMYENSSDRPGAALILQPVGTGRTSTIAWIVHALQVQPSTRTLGLIVVTDRRILAEQIHRVLKARLRSEVLLAFTSQEFQECIAQGRDVVIVTAAHSLRNWTEVSGPVEGTWGVIVDHPLPPTSRLLDTLDVLFHRPIVLALAASMPSARSAGDFLTPGQVFDFHALLDESVVPLVIRTPYELSAKMAITDAATRDQRFSENRQDRTPQDLAWEAQQRIIEVTLDEYRLMAVAKDIAKHWEAVLGPKRGKALVIVHTWAVAQQLTLHLKSQLIPETVAVAGSQFEEDLARQSRRPVGSFGAGISSEQIRAFQQDGPPYLWVSTHAPTGMDLPLSAVYLDRKINRTELLQLLGPLTRKQPQKEAAYLIDYWGDLPEVDRLAYELSLPMLPDEVARDRLERMASRARQVLSLSPVLAQTSANDLTQRNADVQLLRDFTAALNLVGAAFASPKVRQLHADFEEHIRQLYDPAVAEKTAEIAVPQNIPAPIIEDLDMAALFAALATHPHVEPDVEEETPLVQDVRSYFQEREQRPVPPTLAEGILRLLTDAPYLWWEKPTARRAVRRELRQLLTASLPDPEAAQFHLPALLDLLEQHARMQE